MGWLRGDSRAIPVLLVGRENQGGDSMRYEEPIMEILVLTTADVITASPGVGSGDDVDLGF